MDDYFSFDANLETEGGDIDVTNMTVEELFEFIIKDNDNCSIERKKENIQEKINMAVEEKKMKVGEINTIKKEIDDLFKYREKIRENINNTSSNIRRMNDESKTLTIKLKKYKLLDVDISHYKRYIKNIDEDNTLVKEMKEDKHANIFYDSLKLGEEYLFHNTSNALISTAQFNDVINNINQSAKLLDEIKNNRKELDSLFIQDREYMISIRKGTMKRDKLNRSIDDVEGKIKELKDQLNKLYRPIGSRETSSKFDIYYDEVDFGGILKRCFDPYSGEGFIRGVKL